MSIVAMKNKSVIQYGGASMSKGQGQSGVWLNQGPFGMFRDVASRAYGQGFSINGGRRSGTYIGKSMGMSKNGTSFRGTEAMGSGGHYGAYYNKEPVLVMSLAKTDVEGSQYAYIKPSVLSSKGMLEQKYKWIHSGQYPNYWVQPDANLSLNFSYQAYVDKLAAKNITVTEINNSDKFSGLCTATKCNSNKTISNSTFNSISASAPYAKNSHVPQTSSQHTLAIQRECSLSQPFPFAVNGGASSGTGSSNAYPPPIGEIIYLKPPPSFTKNTCRKLI